MPRYNIFRLIKGKEEELLKKLNSVGLIEVGRKEVDGSILTFFMSTEPKDTPIWWVDLYKDFLGSINEPHNKSYAAILLISSEQTLYGVSLGKTHFYLGNFCDMDFGINMAERVIDSNELRVKNSRLFGSKRNKSIITYQSGSELEYDSGEALQFLKAKSIDKTLWGETVSFGQSVQFDLSGLSPLRLSSFIGRIEEKLKQDPITHVPRAEIIRDENTLGKLDQRLVQALVGSFDNLDNMGNDALLDMNETGLSGVDFVFLDKNEFTYMWKRNKQPIYGEITLESLKEFVRLNQIDLYDEINRIKIKVSDEHNQGYTKELKYFLDYVDGDNYCLLEGKWYKFNQQYIDFIKKEVDKIRKDESTINFIQSDYEAYKNQLPLEEQRKTYPEKYFNQKMVEQGYLNLDRENIRVQGFTLERADLYQNETLFFVKIGEPQKLAYAIDQATTTSNLLQNRVNITTLKIEGQTITPKHLCIWVILTRINRIQMLSQINSLNFLIRLVEWSKRTNNAGFTPIVRVSYKVA